MLRNLTAIGLAAGIIIGSATIANAMQGARTGNPPGSEHRPQAEVARGQMDHGSSMMGQGMIGNPQMQAQMAEKMQDCRCCKRMAEMDREPQR